MSKTIKFQAPFERIKLTNTTPEQMLRRAILLQAIIDVTIKPKNCKEQKVHREACEWIFNKNEYFIKTCNEANLEPDYVIKVAREAINVSNRKVQNHQILKTSSL